MKLSALTTELKSCLESCKDGVCTPESHETRKKDPKKAGLKFKGTSKFKGKELKWWDCPDCNSTLLTKD